MKIPENYFGSTEHERWREYYNTWHEGAKQISMEYGILVDVRVEVKDGDKTRPASKHEVIFPPHITRIYFRVLDQDCDSLNRVRAVLKNRAFV